VFKTDSIKTVLLNYAVCALLGSVFEFVCPKRTRESMRIVSSVVLISVIALPLMNFDFNTVLRNVSDEQEEFTQENSLVHTASLMEKEIYKEIENILINEYVDEYEIYITIETDEKEMIINLSRIEVLIDERYKEKIPLLNNALQKEYGDVLIIGVKKDE
jgi:hypothetical protein